MSEINLSYVLTTYNKLPYLRELVNDLVNNCGKDEEIVVVDGASTDGSTEYLKKLYDEGRIHIFVSEKDLGEAHGFNKGTLLARGELVKYISDDDVFFYDRIRELKTFMLSHPEIDIMGSNGWAIHMKDIIRNKELAKEDNSSYFNKAMDEYLVNGKPFPFTGLGLMVRKMSVAGFGLFSTDSIWVDYEFGLRVTSHRKLSIGWWDSYCYVRLQNGDSNSVRYYEKMMDETRILDEYYRARIAKPLKRGSWASVRFKAKQFIVEAFWMIKRGAGNRQEGNTVLAAVSSNNSDGDTLSIGEKISIVRESSRSFRKQGGDFRWKPRV